MDAATRRDLAIIMHTVDYLVNLNGQDTMAVVECTQSMVNDLLDECVQPIVNYVRMFCSVIDNQSQAELIASNILVSFAEA